MIKKHIHEIFQSHLKGIRSSREIDQLSRIYYEDKIRNQFSRIEDIDIFIKADLDAIVKGKPIQYVVGKSYFFDGYYLVNETTLIPRPETEELIYWILSSHSNGPYKILDIGTGTGCIAITIQKHIPKSEIIAIDIAKDALRIAEKNALAHKVDIQWRYCDFLKNNAWEDLGFFDIIVSNPPYIGRSEQKKMSASTLEYEPHLALFSPDDPLLFYRKIAEFGTKFLLDQGSIYLELNEYRYIEIQKIFSEKGYSKIELKKDLQGKYRMAKVLK
jgi:release factor glutamine methyltransferase